MLNIHRLRDVLKKLETTSDLARNLIKRASIVIEPLATTAPPIPEPCAIESSSSQTVTSQPKNSLSSQSVNYSKAPPQTVTKNEIKMLIYSNNYKKIAEHEHEHEKHQQQQPKTIGAALFNASLFLKAVSNGGISGVSVSAKANCRNLRENSKIEDNQSKHNQSSHNMSSPSLETNSQGEIEVAMTQQHQLNKQLADTTTTKTSLNGVSCDGNVSGDGGSGMAEQSGGNAKPCFKSSLADILHFMELVGNLKHTKRTGWVLRDVSDCESISGHMYRMSMMTFLLEDTEGLNRIRCMELALVHDLAESLVGDLTPFCGVAKEDKKAMELKAMADICKLVEPRGKRIMDLFEEYENGQSAESKFVKDLDRLDMVMQAFEYEKRDNCLMKHQEFFDSTEGKFQHPFIQKIVEEICDQRKALVEANIIAKGQLNLKTIAPNCPPCLEHRNERS